MQIDCLKPRMAQLEAEKMLRRKWLQTRFGDLRVVFDIYLPYYFFDVLIHNGKKEKTLLWAADAVTGHLDPYYFPLRLTGDLIKLEITRYIPTELAEGRAFQFLKEKIRRGIWQQGFFKIKDLRITNQRAEPFYLPYFVGVYERQGRAHLEIINARQGRWEGAKLREIITFWFQRPLEPPALSQSIFDGDS